MPFRICYLPVVVNRDIPALDPPTRERVKTAIAERLAADPAQYGKPLRRSLSGLRKLRVGDQRVIFRIEGGEVLVVGIGHRKRIYRAMAARPPAIHEPPGEYGKDGREGQAGKDVKARRAESARKPAKCPACGASPVASILWGMPLMDDKLERELAAGRVTLGGCCVSGDDPAWECPRCGQKIHRKDPKRERRADDRQER